MFYKIGILKHFANFTGEHMCWRLVAASENMATRKWLHINRINKGSKKTRNKLLHCKLNFAKINRKFAIASRNVEMLHAYLWYKTHMVVQYVGFEKLCRKENLF